MKEYLEQLEKTLMEYGFSKRDGKERLIIYEKKVSKDCERIVAIGPLNVFMFDDDGKSPISDTFIHAFDGTETMIQFRKSNAFMFDFPFKDRNTEEFMEYRLMA